MRLIGAGGMGEVWEARHLQLDAPVAIKFALERRACDPMHLERFRREACALARLDAPEIVRVLDAGDYENHPYLVMELLVGESLKARLDREGRISLENAAAIATKLGRALAVIHRAGMVHRDVTPGNLFLLAPTPELPELRVKILDFGIAKTVSGDSRITTSGALIGSPAYMSPEQARTEVVDASSDLWSLAAVLYRCITGHDAFAGPSIADVLFRICAGELPSASKADPSLPTALDGFFARAFARNRQFRFEDAMVMALEFAEIIDTHISSSGRIAKTIGKEMPATRVFLRDNDTTSIISSGEPTRPNRRSLLHHAGVIVSSGAVGAAISLSFVQSSGSRGVSPEASRVALSVAQPKTVLSSASTSVAAYAPPLGTIVMVATAPTLASSARRIAPTERVVPIQPKPKKLEPRTDSNAHSATVEVDPLFGLPVERTDRARVRRDIPVPRGGDPAH